MSLKVCQGSEQTAHEFRKTEDPSPVLDVSMFSLPPSPDMEFALRICFVEVSDKFALLLFIMNGCNNSLSQLCFEINRRLSEIHVSHTLGCEGDWNT